MATGTSNPPTVTPLGTLAPPINLNPYPSYLPSAFDDSLSMVEKINLLIQQFQTVIDNNNSLASQWQTVTDWVTGDGETQAIQNQLETMKTNGEFDTIINQTILGSKETIDIQSTAPTSPDTTTMWWQSTPVTVSF